MIISDGVGGGLGHVLDLANWFLSEVSVVFHILLDDSGSWELVVGKIRLDTIFSSIFWNILRLAENMCLWIEFPVIVSVFLLTTFIIAMCLYVKGLDLRTLLNLYVIWSDDILGDIVIESSLVTICEVGIFDSLGKNIIPGERFGKWFSIENE